MSQMCVNKFQEGEGRPAPITPLLLRARQICDRFLYVLDKCHDSGPTPKGASFHPLTHRPRLREHLRGRHVKARWCGGKLWHAVF